MTKRSETRAAGRRKIKPPVRPVSTRTALGRWLREHAMTTRDLMDRLHALAAKRHIPERYLPEQKTMGDAIGGRHCPGPIVLMLIRDITSGGVDLQHWSAEIIARG